MCAKKRGRIIFVASLPVTLTALPAGPQRRWLAGDHEPAGRRSWHFNGPFQSQQEARCPEAGLALQPGASTKTGSCWGQHRSLPASGWDAARARLHWSGGERSPLWFVSLTLAGQGSLGSHVNAGRGIRCRCGGFRMRG